MASEPFTLGALQQRLGLAFRQTALLQEALTHSSFANERDDQERQDNQRLEFLGDAVLDLIVGRWLYERLPNAPEGELTTLRARIVRTEALADLAHALDLGRYMRFGRGEEASGGRDKPANLCAAYEALAGAIYLDQGLPAVQRWFLPALERQALEIEGAREAKDAKTELQEMTQARLHVTPRYELVSADGPDHARVFTERVLVNDVCWGAGSGPSRQLAQQAAARQALAARSPLNNE